MKRFARENSLSLVFGTVFLASLIGQSVAGWKAFNAEQLSHDESTISYARFLYSSEFGAAMLENWQSEFLQFFTFILATIWLVQKGSNESKKLDEIGLESDRKQRVGGWAAPDSPWPARARGFLYHVYANSLLIVMGLIFLGSWFGQSVTGWTVYNSEQSEHQDATLSWGAYLLNPDFWEKSLQNWQSEFLAVGTMAIFTVYLRQRGSPESKPVGAPHDETGSSG